MGCCASVPRESPQDVELQPPQTAHISMPTGGPVMVPPPYRDAQGQPIKHAAFDLSRAQILEGFANMANYLEQNRVTAQAVSVGGAVNAVYLRSRDTTHDVDFFLGDPSSQLNHVVHKAARFADKKTGGQLGIEWFNNATQLFMSADLQRTLLDEAVEQGDVIFQQLGPNGGLLIYAAPWSYAFCGKLDRLCAGDPRPYDVSDAVIYLNKFLEKEGRQAVSARRVFGWCKRYRKQVTDIELQEIDSEFFKQYGHHPIKWTQS